jgi:hypothetical protein
MPASYLNLNSVKIAPFKNPTIPLYGSFANTTPVNMGAKEYRVKQTINIRPPVEIDWPSSELAYHAQKILYLKSKLSPIDQAHVSSC